MDQFDRLAEARYRKIIEGLPQYAWRIFSDGEELAARIFFPEGHDRTKSAPAVMFFHGGMWSSSNAVDFVPLAMQLAEFGIVSILPEYRTGNLYEAGFDEILDEARDAWEWVLENAVELGISPGHISLAGSDIGGLLALHAGMANQTISRKWLKKTVTTETQPAAIILFRPVIDLETSEVKKMMGELPADLVKKIAPASRLRKDLPALFISHGVQDKLMPWRVSEGFAKMWQKSKNPAHFVRLVEGDHAFYHFNVAPTCFEHILFELTAFMNERGIWNIEEFERGLLA